MKVLETVSFLSQNGNSTNKNCFFSSNKDGGINIDAITGELHRATKISDEIEREVLKIKEKFCGANYPNRFVDSVVNDFKRKEEKRCEETVSKTFIKKLHDFTEHKYDTAIKWITKKTSSLFPLKDKNQHPSCKIYIGCLLYTSPSPRDS